MRTFKQRCHRSEFQWTRAVTIFIFTSTIFPASGLAASDSDPMLKRAINEYSSAMEISSRDQRLSAFSRSELLFRQVVESVESEGGEPTAELLLNLGNAALQAEHLGPAILNYRRALIRSPDNGKARQNLAFARSQVDDWAKYDADEPFIDTLFFWRGSFSTSSLLGFAALSFFLAAALVAASIAFRQSMLRNLALLPAIVWAVLLLSLAGAPQEQTDAVITSAEVVLRNANSSNAKEVLSQPLPDGTEVKVLEQRDEWTEIQMTGRSGWVLSHQIETINPTP